MSEDILLEQLKTIRNLCDIAQHIRLSDDFPGTHLHTILELMFGEIQTVNDDNCVVRDKD